MPPPSTQSTSTKSPSLLYTKSTVSAAGNGSTVINVTVSRQSAEMTHNITYSYGSNSITHTNIATSDSYDVPITWVTNATSARIDVTCETFLNGSSLGTSSDYGTFNVPASVVPSVEMNYRIVNPALEKVIKGVSSIKFNCTASGVSGSTISSSYVSFNDKSIPLDGSTGILATTGNTTFTAHCTDSRGRSASKSVTIPIADYEKPNIEITDIKNVDGKLNVSLSYSWYNISGNTAIVELQYRKPNDTEYIVGQSLSLSEYRGNITLESEEAIQSDVNYEVQVKVADSISSYSAHTQIIQSYPIIDVYQDDHGVKSVGISGAAMEDGTTTVHNTVVFKSNQYVFSVNTNPGQSGYIELATITISNTYCDSPCIFEIAHRGHNTVEKLYLQFAGGNTVDPELSALISTDSDIYYIYKQSESTWGLLTYKTEYDIVDIVGFRQGRYSQMNVEFTGKFLDALPANVIQSTQEVIRKKVTNSNSTWYVNIYANGLAEVYGSRWVGTINSGSWQSYGNLFYYVIPRSTYPVTFILEPMQIICVQSDNGSILTGSYTSLGSETGNTCIYCGDKATVNNIKVVYHSIGYWK